jgi:uncharacterized protein
MTTVNALVPTANGGKYALQLGKHWAHKLDVVFEGERTVIRFPDAVATLDPGPDAIAVSISSDDPETVERMKDVVARHLDRFAFREAPLIYDWQ